MRKLITMIMATAVVSVAGIAYCDESAMVDVVMTIQSVSIVNSGAGAIAISAPAGQSKKTDRAIFKNDSNGAENFAVKIGSTTGAWTPKTDTGAVGVNQYRLKGIWAIWTATITVNDFDDNDIITSNNKDSSSTVFFSDTGTQADVGNPAYDGGYNVPVDSERSIFFRFDAGAVGTTGTSRATISVTATIAP